MQLVVNGNGHYPLYSIGQLGFLMAVLSRPVWSRVNSNPHQRAVQLIRDRKIRVYSVMGLELTWCCLVTLALALFWLSKLVFLLRGMLAWGTGRAIAIDCYAFFAIHTMLALLSVIAPMVLMAIAFGLIVPNLLSSALSEYNDELGAAGALFGPGYYLLIAAGLALVSYHYVPVAGYVPAVFLVIFLLMLVYYHQHIPGR